MPQRPNVLILLSDQHHRGYLGAAGHRLVQTPHLDRLAREGMRFSNAYCPAPLCGPCRMSFLSALYPHETGIYFNGQPLPSDTPTFAHGFGAAGYETALIGRMHLVGPDQHHGFEQRLGGDVTATTLGGGRFPQTQGLPAGGDARTFLRSGPGDSAYLHYDRRIADLTLHWLRRWERQRPFMLTVGFALPHCPYVCSREDYERYRGRVQLPPDPHGDRISAHPFLAALLQGQRRDANVTEEDLLRTLTAYHGCVTALDRQIGRILAALDELGLAENTLVLYSSDHGDALGEHGLWHKSSLLEGSAGIPMLLRWPGHVPAGRVEDHAVNLLDVGPTLLDAAGAPAMPLVSGRSFRALWQGGGDWPDQTFSEYRGYRDPTLCRMIRRGAWKLIYYQGLPPQLFNLERDPGETQDLAAHPEHQATRHDLEARVLEGWDPAALARQTQHWQQRNAYLFEWFRSRPRPDPDLYRGPSGCNRLDEVPFMPAADGGVGRY